MSNEQNTNPIQTNITPGLLCEVAIGEELASQQLTECTISKKEKG